MTKIIYEHHTGGDMNKQPKTITLSPDAISYVHQVAEAEGRSFSNTTEAIICRYRQMSEQLSLRA
jgi:hypothetical protein